MSPLIRSLLISLVEIFAVLLFILYHTLGTPTAILCDGHLSNPILSLKSHSQSQVVFPNLFQHTHVVRLLVLRDLPAQTVSLIGLLGRLTAILIETFFDLLF